MGKCYQFCDLNNLPDDPVEVSKQYLSHPNDIKIFPFLCLYMVPVYEKLTGRKNTMQELAKEFDRRWKRKIAR